MEAVKLTFPIVAVSGFSSDAGKTSVLCELLRGCPGWEAIKMTRGHYRSCGKSAHACCVSHLLRDEPVVMSGREQTDAPGKDTGRYWAAGASNVHWAIVTDEQVERGVQMALERVRAPGVFIEGTSFLKFINVDFALMVARASGGKIKPSARRALAEAKASALYLFDDTREGAARARERFHKWRETSADRTVMEDLPVYTSEDVPQLVARIHEIDARTNGRAILKLG